MILRETKSINKTKQLNKQISPCGKKRYNIGQHRETKLHTFTDKQKNQHTNAHTK